MHSSAPRTCTRRRRPCGRASSPPPPPPPPALGTRRRRRRRRSSPSSLASSPSLRTRLPSAAFDCLRLPSIAFDCLRLPSTAFDCLRLPPTALDCLTFDCLLTFTANTRLPSNHHSERQCAPCRRRAIHSLNTRCAERMHAGARVRVPSRHRATSHGACARSSPTLALPSPSDASRSSRPPPSPPCSPRCR